MCNATEVVTAFLMRKDRVLIVRRSRAVGSFPNRWSAISGHLEHAPLQQAYIEIEEETGLRSADVRLLAEGDPIEVEDAQGGRWRVHPFAFKVLSDAPIRLDWENIEYRWVRPAELKRVDAVPGLAEALDRVWP